MTMIRLPIRATKMSNASKRVNQWAVVLSTLLAGIPAPAQVTPLWTINNFQPHLQVQGTYFNNADLTSPVLTRSDATIDFDWGTGSPDPTIGTDTFSVRWIGTIKPWSTENYTFYAQSDDGVRLWINNQLIIDRWVDQAGAEWASAPIALVGGISYDIKLEYYANTGAAMIKLRWSSSTYVTKEIVGAVNNNNSSYYGASSYFGSAIASLGSGRFAVSSPQQQRDPLATTGWGRIWTGDLAGTLQVLPTEAASNPVGYGNSLASFNDGRLVLGNSSSLNFGAVQLRASTGEVLGEWFSPETANIGFGTAIAALPGNRFAVSATSATVGGLANAGKVFVYDANAVGPPVATIPNPNSSQYYFGGALAPIGTDRFMISDAAAPGNPQVTACYGRVTIHNLDGQLVARVTNSAPSSYGDYFGRALVAVDDHRFLVGAPYADASY